MARSEVAAGSFGPNAWLVDDMYDRFLVDPSSVSESWREFFADYRAAPVPPPQNRGRDGPGLQRRRPRPPLRPLRLRRPAPNLPRGPKIR